MRQLVEDARLALRRLGRTPGWTAAVLTTVAVGIGAVTAVFTVADAVLFRPLPFDQSERVVALCETAERVKEFCVASPPNVASWSAASRTIESFGVARDWPFQLRAGERAEPIQGGIASAGFFDLLRAPLARGRSFVADDLASGRAPVALLSHGLWSRRFGADDAAVGATIAVDDRPVTVIGVLAPDARLPGFEEVELWLPLTAIADDVDNRAWRGFVALGRLAPGASLESARREMELVRAALAAEFPETNRDWGLSIERYRDRVAGAARPTLTLLLAAVACLLLIACVNVVHLLLARTSGREGELAVRAALGAAPGTLARLLVGETLLLSAAGGALGLLVAAVAVPGLLALAPPGLPRRAEIGVDARVLLVATAVTVAAALLVAVVPARRARRTRLAQALHGVRATSGGGTRLRDLLVVAQIALALQLLVGAALLARGFVRLTAWTPGIPVERLVPVWLTASPGVYRTGDDAARLFERLAEEARTLPGVEAVGLASAGPLFGGVETAEIELVGESPGGGAPPSVRWFDVSPGFFATLGVPIVGGRDLSAADRAGAPPVALVNRAFAARFWPDADAVGRRVRVQQRELEIVGVVADLPPPRPDQSPAPEIYWPQLQAPRWGSYLLLRLAPGAAPVERALEARLTAIEPELALGGFQSLDRLFLRRTVSPRFVLVLVAAFAVVALVLAALGTYGLLAYSVAARTRELGVRMALGAAPARLHADVMRRGLLLALFGLTIGLAALVASARFLRSLLYGVAPADPAALAAAIAIFLAVAATACAIPARRASETDPLAALRSD